MSLLTLSVDLALAIIVLEIGWTIWRRRYALLATAGAGAALLVALRAQIADAPPVFVLVALAAGGVFHVLDVARRLR